jgi:cytochrome c-type biogenesis protein CcmH
VTRLLLALALVCTLVPAAGAVDPREKLADPALESRARDISKGLRCVVCQNQSIDDSDATLARDLRLLVRERITAGDSDSQVIDYVVSRYGDFVLLKPPFKVSTLALWAGPAIIVLFALFGAFAYFRRQRTIATTGGVKELTDEERRRLNALLKDGKP